MTRPRKLAALSVATAAALLATLVVEALLALHGGRVALSSAPPPRHPESVGNVGAPLSYVVLGDSTAAGVGGDYARGIARVTARHLARSRRVRLVNLAVSGATVADVRQDQLPAAMRLRPDVVLLAAGANDVTRLTRGAALRQDLFRIVIGLRAANPAIDIVVTGAPDMGSVPRFAQPLRTLAGQQTGRVNAAFADAARSHGLIWARLADETGPAFRRDRSLFAADRFHPNDRGYAVWVPVLNAALDRASLGEARKAGGAAKAPPALQAVAISSRRPRKG